jgi:hypothetical protein
MFDLDRAGEYREPGGALVIIADQPPFDFFYTDLVVGNYIRANSSTPQQVNNQGLWANNAGQAAWGTGSTYGTFNYRSVFSLSVGPDDDRAAVTGLWADVVPFTGASTLFTPGAFWMLYDNGLPAGAEFRAGLFTARLVSLSTAPPPSVPEPSSALLVSLAIGGAGVIGFRRRMIFAART